MDDLISRAAAIEAVYSKPSHKMAIEVLKEVPAVDAVPVGWLDAQIRGYASALKSTELKALVLVKQMWQKEQEGV